MGYLLTHPLLDLVLLVLTGTPERAPSRLNRFLTIRFCFRFDDGNAFGNADIITPLSEVLVLISQTGNTYDLKFSNTDPSVLGGSLFGGSIDFDNTLSVLSFESRVWR